MTLVVFQYPLAIITFAVCALCAMWLGHTRQDNHMPLLILGFLTIAKVLVCLFFSIPLEEIVCMLLILFLIACLCRRKEGNP